MPIWQPEEVIFPHVRADGRHMNAFFSVKGISERKGGWELFTSETPCFTLRNWTALSINIYIRLVSLSSSAAKLSFGYGVKTFRTEYLGFFSLLFWFCFAEMLQKVVKPWNTWTGFVSCLSILIIDHEDGKHQEVWLNTYISGLKTMVLCV